MTRGIPSPDGKWKARRRGGLDTMTRPQMDVLLTLRSAKQEGFPFIPITANRKTIRVLTERDWIVSVDLVESAYQITGRGEKALAVYEKPTRRYDKMCPDCGKPRKVSKNGTLTPYCDEHNKYHANRQYHLKGHQYKPEIPCSKCGKRPRMKYPSGFVIAYCKSCRKRMRKAEKRRKTKRLLDRIARGESVLCRCGKPRYHTQNTVYDYCYEHYREQQNSYNRDKREQSRTPKKGKSPNVPSSKPLSEGVR